MYVYRITLTDIFEIGSRNVPVSMTDVYCTMYIIHNNTMVQKSMAIIIPVSVIENLDLLVAL